MLVFGSGSVHPRQKGGQTYTGTMDEPICGANTNIFCDGAGQVCPPAKRRTIVRLGSKQTSLAFTH
jgi:hypothetical protein